MAKRGIIGIDVGGTKTLFALFNEKLEVIEEIKTKTQPDKGEKFFTANLTNSVEALVKRAEKKDLVLVAVGIGCAGSVDNDKGSIRTSPNIPFLKGYPFRSRLSKLTGANVFIANDCQAGLYGEHQVGAAKGHKHVIGIFLGTGIGGALIIDGRPHLGASGYAGDIGHYLMHPIGPLAGAENHGFLDDMASRTALAGEAARLASKQWAPHLLKTVGTDITNIRSGQLADAIENGDKSIEDMVRGRARIVGIALSNMVDFINPEIVLLGGGLVEAMPDLIRKEVKTGIEEHATAEALDGLQIVVAKLKGHAVTTGAAKLALDVFGNNQHVTTGADNTSKVTS